MSIPSCFDITTNRAQWGSYKWNPTRNGGADVLPLHVADMDFSAPPCVCDALKRAAEYGCFGYTDVLPSYTNAFTQWCEKRYGTSCKPEWVLFSDSSTSAMLNALRCLAKYNAAKHVVALEPGYGGYKMLAEHTELTYIPCSLRRPKNENTYSIDLAALEDLLRLHSPAILIICNPHNPTGHVWTQYELEAVTDICSRLHICILSDEVFADFTAPNLTHIPFFSVAQSLSMPSVTILSPTKAFNLSGLHISCTVTDNNLLVNALRTEYAQYGFYEPNMLALVAAQAAWEHADDWIDQLNNYIADNRAVVTRALQQQDIELFPMDGTYLQWLSYNRTGLDEKTFMKRCSQQRVLVSAGSQFGLNTKGCFRLSLASPRSIVEEGITRLARVFS